MTSFLASHMATPFSRSTWCCCLPGLAAKGDILQCFPHFSQSGIELCLLKLCQHLHVELYHNSLLQYKYRVLSGPERFKSHCYGHCYGRHMQQHCIHLFECLAEHVHSVALSEAHVEPCILPNAQNNSSDASCMLDINCQEFGMLLHTSQVHLSKLIVSLVMSLTKSLPSPPLPSPPLPSPTFTTCRGGGLLTRLIYARFQELVTSGHMHALPTLLPGQWHAGLKAVKTILRRIFIKRDRAWKSYTKVPTMVMTNSATCADKN